MLRQLFQKWGLPERLRVDNGAPWGSRGDLPTDLVCWLAGLGVAVTANSPCRPQENGVVERSQGVGKKWAEPSACESVAELQGRLDIVDRWQRERYPSVQGKSRSQAYEGLSHSGRPYESTNESQVWELPKVWELIGTHMVPRQVDKQGKLSLYNRPYSVSLAWAGQTIWVGFDPLAGAWTFQDKEGHEIRRQIAPELSRDAVIAMEVTSRRRGVHAAKPYGRISTAQPTGR
jgi:putative transposase